MGLEQLSVWEVVEQAVGKAVDVPEFQREFVWRPDQVKLLAESLYREYPVGSFLLWDSSSYQQAKTAQGTQASLWIVDGQQRTTALCLLLGQKPYWWADAESWNEALERYDVLVNVVPNGSLDRLEFGLPNPIRRQDPRWVSLRRVLAIPKVEALTPLAQEIVSRLPEDSGTGMELFAKVHALLQRLHTIRNRDIPVVKIKHEVEDVAEIFARLNQAGTRVREADVVLALAAVRTPGWVREEYLPFRNDLEERGWDLDAGVFVRTMTGIGRGRARLIEVPQDFWNSENLRAVWKTSRDAIFDCLKRLAEHGILGADILPSVNSLIPLFGLHHRWSGTGGYRFSRALRWFLLANRDGRYSGSAITALNEDVRAITEAAGFDDALQNLERRLRVPDTVDPAEFLERYDRAGNRFLTLMVYLVLFRRGALDWVDRTRIGYDKTGAPVATGYEPQWHHIFPRKVLKIAGISEDDRHALANITVLNEATNVRRIGAKGPAEYIQELCISANVLRGHLIPEPFARVAQDPAELRKQWDAEKYGEFLVQRAQLLADEANSFLSGLGEPR